MLVRHVYRNHPPPGCQAREVADADVCGDNIKATLKKAVVEYHPDKQVGAGREWREQLRNARVAFRRQLPVMCSGMRFWVHSMLRMRMSAELRQALLCSRVACSAWGGGVRQSALVMPS